MAEVYSRTGYLEGYPEGIERHFWHVARFDLVYRWLTPCIRAGDLVMDVGCGTGLVVGELRSRGVNVRGVERGSAPVAPDVAPAVDTGTDLFDLEPSVRAGITTALLLDVIEHIGDRRDFLRRLHAALPNCRTVLITVPARMELWSEYDEYWGHHLRYDRVTLERELSESGFTAKKTAYFFHWLYLASLAMVKLGVRRSTDFQPIPRRGLKPLLHRMLGGFTRLESRLVPARVPGSSIICLAERSDHAAA